MLRKTISLILLSSALTLAACNTVRGAAEDVESVADAADRTT